jgi:site-specific recombinase XerD
MPGLYRKKKHYYGVFYAPDRRPRQKWIALKTRDRKVAVAKMRELEILQAVGEYDPWKDPAPQEGVTLKEAAESFTRARRREDLSHATRRSESSILGLFENQFPGGVALSAIALKDVEGFFSELRRRGARPSTLHTYHTRLAQFFRWCEAEGMVRESPMARLRRPRSAKTSVRFLTEEEFERILASIRSSEDSPWLEHVVQVAVATGMRVSELCEMRRDWLSLSPPAVTVKRSATYRPKSHSERHIPLAGDAAEILLGLLQARRGASGHVFVDANGRPLRPTRVSKAFKRHVRLAGLSEEYSFHTLRHTFASWLVKSGTDLYRVRDLLGHQSVEVTERYAHLKPESLRAAVEKTFGSSGAEN